MDVAFIGVLKPPALAPIGSAGNGDGAHRVPGHGMGPCTLHNPSYDFNDELIPLGATAWVHIAEEWLRAGTRTLRHARQG